MNRGPILAEIATTPHNGKMAEIFVERGLPETGTSELYFTALTTHEDGGSKGFAIPADKSMILSFAWSLIRELELNG